LETRGNDLSAKGKKVPRLIDERLVTALSHSTREHALAVFRDRPASTKEIAEELGQSVSAVWHHVDTLLKLDCIEEVESKQRRGAYERFYRATAECYFSDEAWERVPQDDRLPIVMRVLRSIASDLDEAIKGGTVDESEDHLSRTPLSLDKTGWKEVSALFGDTLEKLLEIRQKCRVRIEETGEKPIRASASIMHFRLPPRTPTA
jgi:predicted ArsR family transcriptional regulator